MTTRVLHLIERLSLGGAARSLLGLGRYSARKGYDHAAVSLLPPDARALRQARATGLEVAQLDESRLPRQIEEADIVHVHFWNAPALYRVLQLPWPEARVLCWCHVSGEHPPQVLTPEMAGFFDALVASSPLTAELPVFKAD